MLFERGRLRIDQKLEGTKVIPRCTVSANFLVETGNVIRHTNGRLELHFS